MRRYTTTKRVLKEELTILFNTLRNLRGEADSKKRVSETYTKAAQSVQRKIEAIKVVLEHLNGG